MKPMFRTAALVALISLAGPVVAQDRMTQDLCQGSWDAFGALMPAPDTGGELSVSDAGWCVIEDVVFPLESALNARIASVRWRGSDVVRFVEDGLPPRAIEIYGDGLVLETVTGNRNWDYLYQVQMSGNPMAFGLSMRWDGVQNSVTVDEVYYDFGIGGRVEATARVEGIDLTNMIAMQSSAGSIGVRELTVRSEFSGWFETFLLMPLGLAVLEEGETPPAAQIEALKAQAVAFIDLLSDDVLPGPSKSTLAEIIAALPSPRGVAQVQLNAEPTIGAARAIPFMAGNDVGDALDAALEGVTVLVTWSPEEDG